MLLFIILIAAYYLLRHLRDDYNIIDIVICTYIITQYRKNIYINISKTGIVFTMYFYLIK